VHLSFITSLTEHVRQGGKSDSKSLESSSDINESDSLDLNFPKLFWLVRDFQDYNDLNDTYKGDAKKYLEDVLKETKNEEHDNIRKGLNKIFPKERRWCSVLPQPALKTDLLPEMDRQKIDPDFLGAVENLKDEIKKEIEPKMKGKTPLSPEEFGMLVDFCVTAMNARIGNVNFFVPDVQAQFILKKAVDMFADSMEAIAKTFPIAAADLEAQYEQHKKTSLKYFNAHAYGPTKEALSEKLSEELDKKHKLYNGRNMDAYSQAYLGFGNLQNMLVAAFIVVLLFLLLPRLLSVFLIVALGGVVVFGNVPLHRITHSITELVLAVSSSGQGKLVAISILILLVAYLLMDFWFY